MISQALLNLVKRFEGCRLKAYQDQGGIWTCGYGQTGADIGPNTVWTMQEAEARLEQSLEKVLLGVRNMVISPISENQLDALCSFAYNCGLHALQHSHLLIFVNNSNWDEAGAQFLRWSKVNGIDNPGLRKRREAERDLFLS